MWSFNLHRSTRYVASSNSRVWRGSAQVCARPPTSSSPVTHLVESVRHASHGTAGRANGPKNGPGKRLGAKKSGGSYVIPGNIIFRQRGTKWHPGENVGMGRDHTIFSLETGYVKYYRNPSLHPKRRYIGVVFQRNQTLPTPLHVPRRRRFGLVAVPRTPDPHPPAPEDDGGLAGRPGMTVREVAKRYNVDAEVVREARRKKAEGRVPIKDLRQMRNYGYRESNWQIGRSAERAEITVPQYDKRDRWAAWRSKVKQRKDPKFTLGLAMGRKKSQRKQRQKRR